MFEDLRDVLIAKIGIEERAAVFGERLADEAATEEEALGFEHRQHADQFSRLGKGGVMGPITVDALDGAVAVKLGKAALRVRFHPGVPYGRVAVIAEKLDHAGKLEPRA